MLKRAPPTESEQDENNNSLPSVHSSEPKRRQIETIAEDSGENDLVPKRRRASRVSCACDQCRSKKDKCDGFRPTCSTCTLLSRVCTYRSSPKKRGVPTGYIRTLEILWGIIFSEIKGSENATQVLLRTRNIPSRLATLSRDGEGRDSYISAWKNSTVLKDIEKILDQREGDITPIKFEDGDPSRLAEVPRIVAPQNYEWQVPADLECDNELAVPYRTSDNYPSTSLDMRQSTLDSPSYPEVQIGGRNQSSGEVPVGSTIVNAPIQPSELGHSQSQSSCPPAIRLPSSAWQLFDIYFTYTHCWFPILERHDILRTAFGYNRNDIYVDASKSGSGDHAVMWAVLALTAAQDAIGDQQDQSYESKNALLSPMNYYGLARSFIPSDGANYEIGHAQALLILSLIKFGNQDWASAWVSVGFAIRISLYLGLDHPLLGSSDSQNPSSRRKHVFLGCFALETLVASQIGRLPQLRKEHIAKISPLDEEGLDEWQPWKDLVNANPSKAPQNSLHQGPLHALSTFTRFVTVLSILNDICCYKDEKETKLSNWRLVDSQLHRWTAELPEAHRIKQWRSQTVQLPPHILNLHLAYEYTIATLYQCVSNHQNIESIAKREFKIQFADHCKRIVDLVQIYIERYSVSASSPIFAAYLQLIHTVPCDREDKVLRDRNSILDRELQALVRCLDQVWKKRNVLNSVSHFNPGHVCGVSGSSNLPINSKLAHRKAMVPLDLGQSIYVPQQEQPPYNTTRPTNSSSVPMAISSLESDSSLLIHPSSSSSAQQGQGYLNPAAVPTKSDAGGFHASLPSTTIFNTSIDTAFRSLPGPAKLLSLQPNSPTASYLGVQNANDSNYVDQQITNSTDLDALFDELAAFDGAER